MSWNDGYERRKFEARQKKQAEEYRKLGMSEEQIKAMYEFDLEQYKSDRRFYMHTQPFEPIEFDEAEDDDEKLSIFEKFADVLTTSIADSSEKSRYWWVEEIDNPLLAVKLKKLSEEDLELLTKYVFDGYTQKELSDIYGINQKNISKKIKRITNFLNSGV